MSLLTDWNRDDRLLVEFLLNRLAPEDTERLDEASIVDDEVAVRLRSVELDLIDAYTRGTLDRDTRARFESHYLVSPRRCQEVDFARRFVAAIDRAAPVEPVPVASAVSSRRWLVWTLSVATALLVLGCGALLMQAVHLRDSLTRATNERSAFDRLARERQRRIEDLRAAGAAAARDAARAREAGPTPIAALVLMAQTRGIGPVPALAVPAGTDRVAFELRLESDDFGVYQVALRDPSVNQIIWRSAWIAAKLAGDRATVTVAVPAALLKPQHYSLDLTGRRGTDAGQVVGSYAFEIVPR
jgi:hypothetical protein